MDCDLSLPTCCDPVLQEVKYKTLNLRKLKLKLLSKSRFKIGAEAARSNRCLNSEWNSLSLTCLAIDS